mmetsp:Transcript_11538/g.16673  ORF Transcript_11538/g.16673 Transcript_11538/m.16673 type:complete len:221 (-) Transcript_11538:240-902(-)
MKMVHTKLLIELSVSASSSPPVHGITRALHSSCFSSRSLNNGKPFLGRTLSTSRSLRAGQRSFPPSPTYTILPSTSIPEINSSMTLPLQRFWGHRRHVPLLLSKGLTRSRSFSRNEGFVTILSNTPSSSPFRLRMVLMYSILASDTIMQHSLSTPRVFSRAPASSVLTEMPPSSSLKSSTEIPLFQRTARHSSTACVKPTDRVLSRSVSRTSVPSLSKTK